MITCLSHKGQEFVQKTTFKVLPSRKQICRLSLRNRLAVARGKPAIIAIKQNKASSVHLKQNLSNLILFTCFAIAKFAAS